MTSTSRRKESERRGAGSELNPARGEWRLFKGCRFDLVALQVRGAGENPSTRNSSSLLPGTLRAPRSCVPGAALTLLLNKYNHL